MDSRTRRGWFGVQFEQLVADEAAHHVVIETPVAVLELVRFGNVVSCTCHPTEPDPDSAVALDRRGAVDGTFLMSHKLAARDFGIWLDQLLTDDMGAEADFEARVLELAGAR